MNFHEMTDEALAVMSADLDASGVHAPVATGPHPSHIFGGIDGRCFDCDCRPSYRAAEQPCPVN